jgi:predicted adenine nucleotide alpha hydrolase (AANH) superfamily ATPase
MKILLHTCCAPCLIYPLEQLRAKGYGVAGFFYNPNVQPYSEYMNRKQAVKDYSKTNNIEIIFPPYMPSEFSRVVNLREANPERCSICWTLRLKATAKSAKDRGFDTFSTTLLVSPYQDQELLEKIGNDIAREEGVQFYYQDFRPGFKKAHELAKAQGLYCQKYCGCIYSEMERCKKSEKH